MSYIKTAGELIKQIEPKNIDSIKMLFSGNLVSLEVFSNVIHTFVPKKFYINEEAIECLASAIIDLFEELDSDNDGFITYYDFITYYKDSSSVVSLELKQEPRNQSTVFNYIYQPSNSASGKTGIIDVQPIFQNGGEFRDLPGKSILYFNIFAEQYFLTTEDGVFQVDKKFMFSKLIFAPTLANLVHKNAGKNASLDYREKERREKEAFLKLNEMGLRVSDKKLNQLAAEKQKIEDDAQFLRGVNRGTLTRDSKIVCACLLRPFSLMAISCEYPVVVLVQLNGNFGFSDPIPLICRATAMYFDEQSHRLFFGHENGMISYYYLNRQARTEESTDQQQNELKIKRLREMIRSKAIQDLSREDLVLVYPELKQCIFKLDYKESDILHLQEQRLEQQRKARELLSLRAEDIDVIELITYKVFDATESTVKAHSIKVNDIIKEDPDAYLEVAGQPNALERAIRTQKHGAVRLEVDFVFLGAKYAVDGSTKFLAGGRGQWENTIESANLLRIVASGVNGSIVIFNEDVEPIAAFADLHPEGVVGLHVFGDNITSIGYHCVYQIHREAIFSAYLGYVIKKIDVYASFQKSAAYTQRRDVVFSESQMFDADLSKARNQINFIQPPRPGTPIIASFTLGDIIGVIDHSNTLTLFHQQTGAHISRINVKIPNLLRVKFGQATYHYSKDVGYLVAGKQIFSIRAIPNEELGNDYAVWDVLKQQEQELAVQLETQRQDGPPDSSTQNAPIASISKAILGFCVNQAVGEIAIISGELEITFMSLTTGRPVRVVNIAALIPETIEGKNYNSEYNSVETNDAAAQFRETKLIKPGNPPQTLPKIQPDSILDILGDKILNIEVDSKGRVLYVIGSVGIITLYWKSAQLFDMSQVGILGKQEQIPSMEHSVYHPFLGKEPPNPKLLTHLRVQNKETVQNNYCYSLKINFASIWKDPKYCTMIGNIYRFQLISANRKKKQLFVVDSLSPTSVFAISTSTSDNYQQAPMNSRVINMIYTGKEATDKDQLLHKRLATAEWYQSNQIVNGTTEYLSLSKKMREYFPQEFVANPADRLKEQRRNVIVDYIDKLCCENKEQPFQITSLCVSNEQFLLAIGTSDGRIVVVDTSSQQFIRQGTIVLPYVLTSASVTCTHFLGSYPLLFSADSRGVCYLHTVRPFDPAFLLVCSWQHGCYCPVSFPCKVDVVQQYDNLNSGVRSLLLPQLAPGAEYAQNCRIRKEIYQYLYYRFIPDSRFWVVFYGEDLSSEVEQRLRGIAARQQTMSSDQTRYEDTESSHYQNVLVGKNQFVSVRMKNAEYAQQTTLERQMSNENQQAKEQEAVMLQYLEITREIRALAGITKYSKSASTTMASLTSLGRKQRKRKTESKIMTAVVIMMICQGPLRTFMENKPALSIYFNVTFPRKQITLEDIAKSTQYRSFRRKLGQDIEVSQKTKKFIEYHEKGVKYEQREEEDVVIRCSTPTTNAEIQKELKGILYRTVNINGKDVQLPLRKASLDSVKLQAAPYTALFLEDQKSILVGDDAGYITQYDISGIFSATQIQPISIGVKFVETVKNAPPEEQITGLVKQSLPNGIAVDLNRLYLTSLFQPKTHVVIRYIYRAHSSPIQRLFGLVDTQQFFTLGQDCRLIAWDYKTAQLLGMAQRVDLSAPSSTLVEYFSKPIFEQPFYRYQEQETGSSQVFSREDLNPNVVTDRKLAPPCFRYEAPPAASYQWCVKPSDITYRAGEFRKACVESSIQMNNSLDYTKNILRRRRAVPTYEEANEDLYMTTGLTPKQAQNGNSWTVRAIMMKSQGYLDGPQTASYNSEIGD